jgi:hypothetical protein
MVARRLTVEIDKKIEDWLAAKEIEGYDIGVVVRAVLHAAELEERLGLK